LLRFAYGIEADVCGAEPCEAQGDYWVGKKNRWGTLRSSVVSKYVSRFV
jgi:hypothetical protein